MICVAGLFLAVSESADSPCKMRYFIAFEEVILKYPLILVDMQLNIRGVSI